ncbi:MAG: phosphatidate cytidylyltransferase [Gallionella sp.]|jgi:phosphatidate cytidylyltransferase|nr:phosphatidate cytidylyltransferase [Gallionella sp.]MCK9353349.1 phosphatidate cytidylyltransferase [Gallionella sp.]
MLKSRVITAIVLLALLLAALFLLPPMAWALLVVAMVMQGTTEWSHLSKLIGRTASLYWWLTLVLMLGLVALDAYAAETVSFYVHLAIYLVSALLWLVVVPTWLMVGWKVERPLAMAAVGWAVLIPTGLAMMDLREAAPSPWLLLFVMGLVWVADIAAYFAGRRFGKNKLAPDISPGKTWEGVAGAIFGVSVYVVLVWSFSPHFSTREILPPLLLTAWWWVALAVIGDLFESAIKRQAGVKDSGALLPGHGGLLDRIDALTSTLPLAALAMLFQRIA